VALSLFSSLTRSALSAAGGCSTYCDSNCAVPVHAVSHSNATLTMITSQPQPRRGNISRAPTNSISSNGTGGSTSAVSSGFHDSRPSMMTRLFT
jgi:hypothetical protein